MDKGGLYNPNTPQLTLNWKTWALETRPKVTHHNLKEAKLPNKLRENGGKPHGTPPAPFKIRKNREYKLFLGEKYSSLGNNLQKLYSNLQHYGAAWFICATSS